MNNTKSAVFGFIEKFKYPIVILALGLVFMLFPEPDSGKKEDYSQSPTISQILSCTRGVGECCVLLSDKGVVVVCEGADNAKVRLEIICAVTSYTGYSSDKITILKMAEIA